MVSICDDLRQLDALLTLLSQKHWPNLQSHALLHCARRRVHRLNKKARLLRALYMWEKSHGGTTPPSGSLGGNFLLPFAYPYNHKLHENTESGSRHYVQ